jgi:hypothetical protein
MTFQKLILVGRRRAWRFHNYLVKKYPEEE